VWALIASLFIGNLLLLVLNLPLAPVWAKLLRIPRPYLYAGILFFASMGAYAVNGSPFDLILLLALGLLGFGMRRFAIPVLPLIVGVILGPRVELQGRRALQLSSGDPKGLIGSVDVATGQFVISVLAVVVYVIILIVLFWPLLFKVIRRLLPARAESAVEHLAEELHHDLDTDIDGRLLATAHTEAIRLPAAMQSTGASPGDPPPPSPESPSSTDDSRPDAPKESR
jgi:putative tricarboxylic transport membrane protein